MTSPTSLQRWEQVKELLHQALPLAPEERVRFLDEACGDASLRAELESLLAAGEDVRNSFLQSAPQVAGPPDALEPEQIFSERFRLVRKLGQGGMGQVWLAEQTAPVRRQVALKLIKAGMYDEAVVQRFQSERQALAIMDHPAIAKVFDAGATPQGQPYFVMEYVPGLPITEYCDQKKLKIKDRLELFIQACEGVQHAHQKAIIHRDLKPANILVVDVDGKPTARIIDFGLAKATTPQVAGETLTQLGYFVGTPGFMSPEQANPGVQGGAQDIDTRTDVYSLGVVLYVLLAGLQPFETRQRQKQPLDELLRKVREEEPPRPSAKVSSDRSTSAATAEARGTDPKQLVKLLRGDLDWITMRALEKDRARRYGSPAELAGDIRRFLNHEPVVARPASAGYRLRKYTRRHRVAMTIAAGFVLLLAVVSVLQALELRRITRERDRANRERDRATRITDFMTGMFKVSDPSQARGNSVTAREILDKASNDIDTGLAKDPELQALLMYTMGNVYVGLGLDVRAQSLLEHALDIQRRFLGPEHPETLESAASLANALRLQGRYPESEQIERQTIELQRRVLGPEDLDTLRSLSDLGATLYSEGRYPEAEKLQRNTVDMERRVLGPQHTDTLLSMRDLSATLRREGQWGEAEKLQHEVLDIQTRMLGPDHPDTLRTMNSLANTLLMQAHLPEAEKLYREVLAADRRIQGPQHPATLSAMSNLANALSEEGHYAEAAKLQSETLDIDSRVLGPEHPQTLLAMENLSFTLGNENHLADAEKLQREVIAIGGRVLGPEHPEVLKTENGLAGNLQREGRYAEAEVLERKTLDTERRVLGPDKGETLESMNNLGDTLESEGHYAEAEKLQRETLDIVSRVFGPAHPNTLSVMGNLGEVLEREGHYAEAEKLQRVALENVRRIFGADSPQTVDALQALAICLSYEKRYEQAKPLFAEAVETAGRIKLRDGLSGAWYSSACGAALAGYPDDALDRLRQAIKAGYHGADRMAADEQLKSLRGKEQFKQLVAEARKPAGATTPTPK